MTSEAVASAGTQAGRLQRTRVRFGLGAVDYLTLFLIGLVVVLVSLPRLRRFALRENELDAIALLETLGQDAQASAEALPSGGLGALLAANPRHENRFEDLELLSNGLLRRHGYLFDAEEVEPGVWVLCGWPWEHGRTGLGSFAYVPGTGLLGNENEDGSSDGPGRPPLGEEMLARRAGWRLVHP